MTARTLSHRRLALFALTLCACSGDAGTDKTDDSGTDDSAVVDDSATALTFEQALGDPWATLDGDVTFSIGEESWTVDRIAVTVPPSGQAHAVPERLQLSLTGTPNPGIVAGFAVSGSQTLGLDELPLEELEGSSLQRTQEGVAITLPTDGPGGFAQGLGASSAWGGSWQWFGEAQAEVNVDFSVRGSGVDASEVQRSIVLTSADGALTVGAASMGSETTNCRLGLFQQDTEIHSVTRPCQNLGVVLNQSDGRPSLPSGAGMVTTGDDTLRRLALVLDWRRANLDSSVNTISAWPAMQGGG